MHLVTHCNTPFFIYSFTNIQNPPQVSQIIQSVYSYAVYKKDMFNSGFYVYSKQKNSSYGRQFFLYEFTHDFEKHLLPGDSTFISGANSFSPFHCADISNTEYGPAFDKALNDINYHKLTTVNASVNALTNGIIKDAFLVVTVASNDSVWTWIAADLNHWIKKINKWQPVYVSAELPLELTGEEHVKVYVWNKGKNNLLIDDLKITLTETTDYYKKGILK